MNTSANRTSVRQRNTVLSGGNTGHDTRVANREELEAKFDELLKDDKIDVPESFYEEKLFHEDDPEFLLEVFENLEEKNLSSIMKVSENERVLENYKSDFAKMKKKYGEEIAQL